MDKTIIYYTSNREKTEFERKIQETLLETAGDIPIISVSQKPIDFGENICVGEKEASSQNAYRQLQIGADQAKTKYVMTAESDMLYPPGYFEFTPGLDDRGYLAHPLWVLFAQRGKAKVYCRKPRGSESAMIVNRELLVDRIKFMLKDCDYWGPYSANGEHFPYLLQVMKKENFVLNDAVITFKTDQNMHRGTPHLTRSKTRELRYWGNARELLRKYA